MKIKMCTILLTTIRKARNHCQDVNHCQEEDHYQYHHGTDQLTVRMEITVGIETPVRMGISMQMIKISGLP